MANEDKRLNAEGKIDEVKGKAKAAWGEATGDVSDQIAGRAEEAKGKIKQGVAEVMDEVGDAASRVEDETRRH